LVADFLISPTRLKSTLELSNGASSAPEEDELNTEHLRRLQLFQGFIARVRHNPILPIMPRTFAALRALNAEIRFFSLHAPLYMQERERGRLTLDRQVSLIVESMARYEEQIGCSGLQVIAQHEMYMFLARSKAWQRSSPSPDSAFDPDVALTIAGKLLFAHYRKDVLAGITCVDEGQLNRLSELNHTERHLAYWHDNSTATSNYIVLDDLTLLLLRHVDGRRTAREICLSFNSLLDHHLDETLVYEFFDNLRRLSVIL
jgi:hypothetical protein